MVTLLTEWETWLVTANMAEWLELNPCPCEALCECEDDEEGQVRW
jgi:hypothetical protein